MMTFVTDEEIFKVDGIDGFIGISPCPLSLKKYSFEAIIADQIFDSEHLRTMVYNVQNVSTNSFRQNEFGGFL